MRFDTKAWPCVRRGRPAGGPSAGSAGPFTGTPELYLWHGRPELTQITLYGAQGSGSVAVEAAMTLLGIPYTLVEGATWAEEVARDRVAPVNPMRQIPTRVLPSGEVMTESAAILMHLADNHPKSHLAPLPGDPTPGPS
ncbi:MAG: glutathione S-transferase N-terminal domain-containing protein [Betaproteobacteria bacterium]